MIRSKNKKDFGLDLNSNDNSLRLKPSLPKQSRKSSVTKSPSHKTLQKTLKQQLQEEHYELQQEIEKQMKKIRKQQEHQQQSNNNNDNEEDDYEYNSNEENFQLATIYENDNKNHSPIINKMNQDNLFNTRISPNKQNNNNKFPQVQNINETKLDIIDSDYFNQVVAALHAKILEAQEETKRSYAKADLAMKEKERIEERNEELNSKLSDTRQGLRETQNSLQAIQSSTEQYIQRRDGRDVQYQKIMTDNKNLLLKISELEENYRNLESAYKTEIYNRDDSILRLQKKLDSSLQSLSNNKTEHVRLQCDMTLIVAELETAKRNFDTLESKNKNTEKSIRNEYKNEIIWLEDRLKISQNKMENEKFLETNIITLKQDLTGKNETIRYLETKLEEMSSEKSDLDTKCTALLNQLRQNDTNNRLLETKIRNLEVDYTRSLKDNTNLTRNITTIEELLREMTKKSATLLTDKQNLQAWKSNAEYQLNEFETDSNNKDAEIFRLNTLLNEAVDCLETLEIVEDNNELYNYEDDKNVEFQSNDKEFISPIPPAESKLSGSGYMKNLPQNNINEIKDNINNNNNNKNIINDKDNDNIDNNNNIINDKVIDTNKYIEIGATKDKDIDIKKDKDCLGIKKNKDVDPKKILSDRRNIISNNDKNKDDKSNKIKITPSKIENIIINEDIKAVKVKSITELFASNYGSNDLDELFNTDDLEGDQIQLNEMTTLEINVNDSFGDEFIMKHDEN